MSLADANDLLQVALPSDGGDTLGGFIYSQLDRVPAVGDEIVYEQVTLTVLSLDGRSVRQVRAVISNPSDEPDNHSGT
jgi:CBS domain containing-hemolysin-like protein